MVPRTPSLYASYSRRGTPQRPSHVQQRAHRIHRKDVQGEQNRYHDWNNGIVPVFFIHTYLTSIRSKASVPLLSPSSLKMPQNNKSIVASSCGPLEIPVEPSRRTSWPSCQTTRPTKGASQSMVRSSPSLASDCSAHSL